MIEKNELLLGLMIRFGEHMAGEVGGRDELAPALLTALIVGVLMHSADPEITDSLIEALVPGQGVRWRMEADQMVATMREAVEHLACTPKEAS